MRRWDSKRRQGERRGRIGLIKMSDYIALERETIYDPMPPVNKRIATEDRRKSYGRRHDDLGTCNKATCQCGEWNPTTKRYEVIS
jgi:hypothetical protein